MKVKQTRIVTICLLAAVLMASLLCATLTVETRGYAAMQIVDDYAGAYRNQLAFSAKRGWNNDPNGLLYVNGTWHMYYQYNYDKNTDMTELGWGHMSWGHATSEDLVHWTEQPVALPEGQNGYGMMFSGSAVYDKNNTSGLFDVGANGKVADGQGIVAILTQPTEDQRQILAYSKDNGNSFEVWEEVIGRSDDGSVGDNEFRDPKVFWSEQHNKWLLAVGGGSIRMYSSDNLKEWTFLGETGFWGECPDLSRYTVDGVTKYVLAMSPEDKPQSHQYNGTSREDTYYPAEYYVVGSLDDNGLFVGEQHIRRLEEGIDCYALQTFNDAPDGKTYGVSWSASWKTCGLYERFRQTYNGGMTVATELDLVKDGDGYALARNPVAGYDKLRTNVIGEYNGKLAKGATALSDVRADVADLDIELDFGNGNANRAELWLRVSDVEKVKLVYDVTTQTLTLDRSESSLIAQNTLRYTDKYSKQVELNDGKLKLRVLLDRAFVTVFADGGKADFFSAIFPSAISDGMRLFANGDVNVKAQVHGMQSTFDIPDNDDLFITTDKIDGTVGTSYPVVASSFGSDFDASKVKFEVVDGAQNVRLEQYGAIAYVTPLQQGFARVNVSYNGVSHGGIEVYSYTDGWTSDLDFPRIGDGFAFYGDKGMLLSCDGDGFRFGDKRVTDNFVYSAEFLPSDNAQAAGLVFGVNDTQYNYWVATADTAENKVKIWQAGIGELRSVDYPFEQGQLFKLTLAVNQGVAKVFVNDDSVAALTLKLQNYNGGALGLNVFHGEFKITNVRLVQNDSYEGHLYLGGYSVQKVINITDGHVKLGDNDYSVRNGVLSLSDDYLKTLEAGVSYTFRAVTDFTDFDFDVTADFTSVTVRPTAERFYSGNDVVLELNAGTQVHKVTVDGNDVAFEQRNGNVVISAQDAVAIGFGKHSVQLFTDCGRPIAEFVLAEPVETLTEMEEKATHVFFWVDIAIFGSLILGYVAFVAIKKTKKH